MSLLENRTAKVSSGFWAFFDRHWPWIAVASALFFVVPLFIGSVVPFLWSYRSLSALFSQRLGMDYELSLALAVPLSMIAAASLPITGRWLIFGARSPRKFFMAMGAVFITFGSKPLLAALFMTPFDTSGKYQKCYVWRNGRIVLMSPVNGTCGFDPQSDQQSIPITAEIQEMWRRQNNGGFSLNPITGDPKNITFFDPSTGQPLIYYDKKDDGSFRLFDGPGYDPSTGDELRPVTPPLIKQIIDRSVADSASLAPSHPDNARTSSAPPADGAQEQQTSLSPALSSTSQNVEAYPHPWLSGRLKNVFSEDAQPSAVDDGRAQAKAIWGSQLYVPGDYIALTPVYSPYQRSPPTLSSRDFLYTIDRYRNTPVLVPTRGQLSVWNGGGMPSYETCKNADYGQDPLDIKTLRDNSYLCVRSFSGLTGNMRVNSINTDTSVEFSIYLWALQPSP